MYSKFPTFECFLLSVFLPLTLPLVFPKTADSNPASSLRRRQSDSFSCLILHPQYPDEPPLSTEAPHLSPFLFAASASAYTNPSYPLPFSFTYARTCCSPRPDPPSKPTPSMAFHATKMLSFKTETANPHPIQKSSATLPCSSAPPLPNMPLRSPAPLQKHEIPLHSLLPFHADQRLMRSPFTKIMHTAPASKNVENIDIFWNSSHLFSSLLLS